MVTNNVSTLLELYRRGGTGELFSGTKRWLFYRRRKLRQWLTVNWLKLRRGRYVEKDVHGSTLELDLKATGIHQFLATYGTREPDAINYYESRLRELSEQFDDILVLDLGANIGHQALLAAHNCPHASVVALEPDPRNVERLETNISLNEYGNIEAHHLAAGPKPGVETFNLAEKTNLNHISSVDAEIEVVDQTEVQITTVDELVSERDVEEGTLVILRMDVEGYETEILRGAAELLASDFPVFIFAEVHGRILDNETYNGMIDRLAESGLRLEHADFSYPHDPPESITNWDECRSEDQTGYVFANRFEN